MGEGSAENGLCEVADRLGGVGVGSTVPQGRRGRHGDDVSQRPSRPGNAQACSEPAQQHGDIGSLGSVVGVKLVEDQVGETGVGSGQQGCVGGVHQQQVEHLVVGEQDLRGLGAQGLTVVDDVLGPHGALLAVATDVDPYA